MMPVLKFAAQGPLQYLTLMAGFSAIVGTDPASIAPVSVCQNTNVL